MSADPGSLAAIIERADELARQVVAFMHVRSPGIVCESEDPPIHVAPGLELDRVDVAIAAARYFNALGPYQADDGDGRQEYAYVAGVIAGWKAARDG